jgi:hypothetical protein
MNSGWNKSSEMFPCEQPPRDSYVPPPPPTSLAALRRLGQDLWKLTPFGHALLFSDRTTPILAREPVWRSREMLQLVRLVRFWKAPARCAGGDFWSTPEFASHLPVDISRALFLVFPLHRLPIWFCPRGS